MRDTLNILGRLTKAILNINAFLTIAIDIVLFCLLEDDLRPMMCLVKLMVLCYLLSKNYVGCTYPLNMEESCILMIIFLQTKAHKPELSQLGCNII